MAGLIICGYPGVGKSSIGGWNNCVDLESSNFSKGWEGGKVIFPKSPFSISVMMEPNEKVETVAVPNWVARYIDTGIDLAKQGYTVLMSTHEDVITMLKACTESQKYYDPENITKVFIFCPTLNMKEQWIERLQKRYDETGSSKDYRALSRAKDHYDQDIKSLMKIDLERPWISNSDFPVYHPASIDYNFKDYVSIIQRKVN